VEGGLKSCAIDAAGGIRSRYRRESRLRCYFILSKPRVLLLVALTGVAAMVIEGTLIERPLRFAGVLLGILLAASGANALNQFWDRDIDAIMIRTRNRRPLPLGKISPLSALVFGLGSAIIAIGLLFAAGNGLAALLGFSAFFVYTIIYTIWLKRRTPLNIVIGGVAGAMPPLIGWSAGSGGLGLLPLLMALVIFLWTPVHFWALALCCQEDYGRAGIPMLPVVAGEEKTRRQIGIYLALLSPVTFWQVLCSHPGPLQLLGTLLLNLLLIGKLITLRREKDEAAARGLFFWSIYYLAAIFLLLTATGW
jgi:heme o synthase